MSETPKHSPFRPPLVGLLAISAILIVVALVASLMGRLDRRRQIDEMERQLEQLRIEVETLKDRLKKGD